MRLSRDAGHWQQDAIPSQPHDHEGEKPIFYSVVIVLDSFAQL